MALKYPNRARMTTATTGTGTLTLGAAVVSPSKGYYQSFAAAGVVNGDTVRYVIEDGSDWEIGTGTYSSSGTTLTRTVLESSNADAAINLSGAAEVYASLLGSDLLFPLLTTRGDLVRRGASLPERLALGAAHTLLASDGTDALYRTLTAIMDAVYGSTRGMMLYRGASAWQALAKGTSGHILTQGANDPSWAAAPASGWDMTGQTWQDVSGSRVSATSYQNTTSKPIVAAICWGAGARTMQVSSDNSTWLDLGSGSNQSTATVIPVNYYYRLASGVVTVWAELR